MSEMKFSKWPAWVPIALCYAINVRSVKAKRSLS